MLGGVLGGALAVSAAGGLGFEHAAALTVGSVATSRLPDLDAKVLRGPDHRSFPHSLGFGGGGAMLAALVALTLLVWLRASGEGFGGFTSGTLSVAVLGAVLGYLLHLALDASTRSGISGCLADGR